MKSLLTSVLLILPGIILASNPFKGDKSIKKAEYIYQTTDVDFPSCHASTIVETGNGMLAAWFGGTEERAPDVCIYVSSNIDGKWSKPVTVADGIQNDKQYPCWNPVLFRKDNGDIVLYYKVGPDPRSWWGLYKISKDDGKTWSAETRIPDNLLGPIKDKPVRLPDGTILYPTSVETAAKWTIYMETSDQKLKNWKNIAIDNNNFDCIQPTVLFHPDGKLQLLCRSKNKAINESWSADQGQTWSAVQPTNLPNNNSGIDAVTLSDGRQLLVFNPVTKGRNVLGVALSKDGKNWEAAALLENDPDAKGEYSYPAVIQAKDGSVQITYTWNRKLIKYVVLDLPKLKTKPFANGKWPEK
ncbi:MAG: sialidase family protein [Prolixibacteraceae bacterium]|jgi:alpha-L-fucosidase